MTHQATEAETTVEVYCTGHVRESVGEPRFEYVNVGWSVKPYSCGWATALATWLVKILSGSITRRPLAGTR